MASWSQLTGIDPIGEPSLTNSDLGVWAGGAKATAEWCRPSFPNEHLLRAIRIAGNQTKLAALMGVKRNRISHWLIAKRVPVKSAPAVEAATDGRVTCHDLLPEIFPRQSHAQPLPSCGVLSADHRGLFYLTDNRHTSPPLSKMVPILSVGVKPDCLNNGQFQRLAVG